MCRALGLWFLLSSRSYILNFFAFPLLWKLQVTIAVMTPTVSEISLVFWRDNLSLSKLLAIFHCRECLTVPCFIPLYGIYRTTFILFVYFWAHLRFCWQMFRRYCSQVCSRENMQSNLMFCPLEHWGILWFNTIFFHKLKRNITEYI